MKKYFQLSKYFFPAQMRRHALLQQNKSAQHLHPSCDVVANVSALRTMGNTVPLYENTDFSTKQPAG